MCSYVDVDYLHSGGGLYLGRALGHAAPSESQESKGGVQLRDDLWKMESVKYQIKILGRMKGQMVQEYLKSEDVGSSVATSE